MTDWEAIKRAGQTVFLGLNGFETYHESIGDMYRQIRSTGYVYPSRGTESLTQRIAEGHFEQPELHRVREPEQDIEPER